jgi:gliding motility-associated-like protein
MALVSTGTVFGQAFISAPENVCTTVPNNERYATVYAGVTAETVTDTRWTVTPGVPGTDYRILYGTINTTLPGNQSIVIEFINEGIYTVSATMNTPSGPYSASAFIDVKACPMPVCLGPDISSVMAGFSEDFGFATTRIPLDPARGTTEYTPNNTTLLQPGEYTIYNNTTDIGNPDWVTSLDKSRDTWGGMMLVNADNAQRIFYRRQVNLLCEGAVYTLGAWVKNLDTRAYMEACGANYSNPSLLFEIIDPSNNSVVASYTTNEISVPLQATVSNSGWQEIKFRFKVPHNLSNVIVQVKNNGGGGCGNNLAIDDIRFAYCTPNIYSFFDGQQDPEALQHTMCAGSETTLTAVIVPFDYFAKPHFIWDYSYDNVNWTTIDGDGDGVTGTDTDTLRFEEGSVLLQGDTILLDTVYFRLKVVEDGNDTSRCAAPSKTLEVILLPNPKVEVELNEICIGDTAMLLATGGFTEYIWAPPLDTTVGENEPIPVWPTETSYYTVTGYKDYGSGRTCHRTGEATVLVDDRPVLDTITGPTDICLGEEVALGISPGLIVYDVQWTPTGDMNVTDITHTPAASGVNTYSATVTNGMCVVTATKDIMVRDMPVADAGADTVRQCNDGNFTMAATLAADETGKWSILGAANGAVIAKDDDPMTPINGLGGGQTVTLVWSVEKTSNTACISADTVVLMNVAVPITSLAGPDQLQCGAQDVFTLAGNEPPPGAAGIWKLEQGTAAINDDSQFNTTVTVTGVQDVILSWTISNAICTGKPDTVVLHKNSEPSITLGTIPGVCSNEPVITLPYTAVSDGPTIFSVAAATTNIMPGFTPTGDSAFVPSPLKVAYPAGTPDGTYDFILTLRNDGPGCTRDIPFSVNVVTASVPPTAIVADRPELCAGGTVTLTLQGGTLGTGADWVWYADNCGGTPLGNGPVFTTVVNQTTTYYVRAESAAGCGNSTCVSLPVTIVDKPPVVTFTPAPLNVECVQGKDYTTLFGTPQFSHTPYTNMPLNVTFSDRSDINGCDQTLTRTWTATDACGFTTAASQTITITDKSAPIYTSVKPPDTTVNCDGIPLATDMQAIDSCYGPMTVTPVETREAIAGACSSNYRLRRTWTATDPCGNTNMVVQVITVKELTPPAFTTPAPADVTVDCGNVPAPVTLTATTFCSGTTITATASDQRLDIPGNRCTYQILRTWLAQDECGNSSTVMQTITVQDTARPVFTIAPPADLQVTCDNVPPPANNVTATDNCSSVVITRTQVQEAIDVPGACGSFRLTRIWTATDECGNTNEARQVITVYCDGLPRIALGNDTVLCNGESIRLHADGNGITSTQWSDGSTGPFLNVTNAGTYSVTVANKCGTAADEVKINFIPCDPKPTFANAFSPNGDGNHDRFRPVVSRGLMLGYQLRIYTRWGQLIYADSDPKKGWDGSLHGGPQANVGTYIWWVSYKKEADGAPIILSGIVNVLR